MNLKIVRNLCYISSLITIIIGVSILAIGGNGLQPDDAHLVEIISFSLLEVGLVINLIAHKKSNVSLETIRKDWVACLVVAYLIVYIFSRYLSWLGFIMEWLQILTAIMLYILIAILIVLVLFSLIKRFIKRS